MMVLTKMVLFGTDSDTLMMQLEGIIILILLLVNLIYTSKVSSKQRLYDAR